MKLFAKRDKPLSESQEKFAGKLARNILRSQREIADYLNSKTAGISPKTWKIILTGFCLISGIYLVYLLAQVFN